MDSQGLFSVVRTLIRHYFRHGIVVVGVLGIAAVVAIVVGRNVEWSGWGKDFRAGPGPSTYKERRISLEFENKPLGWAIDHLKKLVPEVNVVLHRDLLNGRIKTRNFSLHLREAALDDVLDAYCASAASNVRLTWRTEGKNIWIEPAAPTAR